MRNTIMFLIISFCVAGCESAMNVGGEDVVQNEDVQAQLDALQDQIDALAGELDGTTTDLQDQIDELTGAGDDDDDAPPGMPYVAHMYNLDGTVTWSDIDDNEPHEDDDCWVMGTETSPGMLPYYRTGIKVDPEQDFLVFVDSWTDTSQPDYSWWSDNDPALVYHDVICNDSMSYYIEEVMIPDFVVDGEGRLYIYAQWHYENWGCQIAIVPLVEFQPATE